jgi:hypothetical protein
MMFVPSTAGPGKELLMWFREVSLARILVSQDPAQDLTEKEVGCGEKWQGSFVKYDPDSRLWKTPQRSLFGGFTEFSETWPRWGTMRNGECWALIIAEPTITEPEYGWLPTPTCADAKNAGGKQNQYDLSRHAREITGKRLSVHYSEWTMDWPLGWTDSMPSAWRELLARV